MTHHRITQTGRNSWTAQSGYQHHSRFGGAFREERRQFRWLVSANPGWPHLIWAVPFFLLLALGFALVVPN